MPVFRVVKNANYTTMSNYHLKDRLLSLKGKGLQSMLLSLPEKWRYSVNGLTEICLEGRDSVNATLQELEQRGYLVRKQTRMPDGRLGGVEYWIYEKPQPCGDSPCTENPDTAQPDADEPFTENPGQLRTNKSNTQESITKERKRLSRGFRSILPPLARPTRTILPLFAVGQDVMPPPKSSRATATKIISLRRVTACEHYERPAGQVPREDGTRRK